MLLQSVVCVYWIVFCAVLWWTMFWGEGVGRASRGAYYCMLHDTTWLPLLFIIIIVIIRAAIAGHFIQTIAHRSIVCLLSISPSLSFPPPLPLICACNCASMNKDPYRNWIRVLIAPLQLFQVAIHCFLSYLYFFCSLLLARPRRPLPRLYPSKTSNTVTERCYVCVCVWYALYTAESIVILSIIPTKKNNRQTLLLLLLRHERIYTHKIFGSV